MFSARTALPPSLLLLLAPAILGCGSCGGDGGAEGEGPGEARPAAAEEPAAAIRRVLEADEAFSSRWIRRRYRNAASWVDGHVTYAREMGALPLTGTPPDFADAFRRHQEAWAAYADLLETTPPERTAAFLDRDLAARPENRELLREAAALNEDISTTWTEVEMWASTRGIGSGPSLRSPPAPVGSARRLMGRRK